MRPLNASAVADSTINFQARLQNNTGGIVPDGNYNIEFKLYNAATGGTALWTEDYLNSNSQGVQTVGGYLTVSLGSITAFPSTINWSQPLWLTMNIGGTSTGTPTWDGEMTPRLPLTAVPYAFQAGNATQLQTVNGSNTATLSFTGPTSNDSLVLPDASGTVCLDSSSACGFIAGSSASFIQNTTSTQTANFNVQGASSTAAAAVIEANNGGTGDLLDLDNSSGTIVNSISNTGSELVKPSTNSTTAFQVQNAAGTAALAVNTSTLTTTLQASVDTATLGAENITTSDFTQPVWTSTGWTVTTTNATHNSGNTSSLIYTGFTPTPGNTYQVTAYFTNSTAGTVGIYLGGNLVANETANFQPGYTDTKVITVTGTGNLTFIPSSNYTGTISLVSVKQLTANPNPVLIVNNASSNANLQVRASNSTSNLFFGLNSGQDDVAANGTSNTAFGSLSLQNNTTGSSNTALGQAALSINSSGASNTAVGSGALQYNTGGSLNTAVGTSSLQVNTTGTQDTAVGTNALISNSVGFNNSAFGYSALSTNTIGYGNTAIGNQALSSTGTNLTDEVGVGAFALQSTSGTSNAALGYGAGQGNTSGAYNIFVGYNAGGSAFATNRNTSGSNNVFLGNGSINNSTLQNSDSSALGYGSTVGQSNVLSLGCTNTINSCTATTSVGIGTAGYAPNLLSVGDQAYGTYGTTGTATTISQSTTAITGSGTTFTSSMNGGTIYYSDGTTATVTYVSATSLTSSVSKTVAAGSTYTIVYGGFNVTSSGTAYLQATTNSPTAFQIQNASASPVFDVDTTDGTVGIGQVASAAYNLAVTGTINATSQIYVNNQAVCTVSSGCGGGGSGYYINNGTTVQSGNFNIQGASTSAPTAIIEENASGTGDLLDLDNSSGTIVHSISNTGSELVEPSSNSTTAFQVQNASPSPVFDVDTTNGRVGIGTNTPNFVLDLEENLNANSFIADHNASSGSSATTGISLQPDTGFGAFIQENSSTNTSSFGGANSFNLVNDNNASLTLGTNAIVQATISSTGATTFKNSTNSTTAFQIQNTAGAPILDVDTTSTAPNGSQLNYLKYPGFESGSFTNAAAGWAGTSATLTQNSSPANAYNGLYSAKVVTTANPGGITTSSFVSAPPISTYIVSFYAEANSGSLTSNLFVVTSTDGANHTCSPASGTTITTSGFQRLYCSLTTTGNMTGLSITYAAASTTLFIDAVQVQSNNYNGTTITVPTLYQIGGIQLRGAITNPVALVSISNSPTTFQVQNSSGLNIFSIDTLNTRIVLGSASATPTLIILGNKNTTGDPTEVDGAMYYNSSLGSFRCGQAGSWTNCVGGLISANTSASTALTGITTGAQSFSSISSIPANYCVSGRVINITASGILTSTTTAQPINFTLKLGATQVSGTSVALTPAASLTNRGWQMQFQMICDAAPSSSSAVTGQGWTVLPGTTSTAADQTSDIPYVATNIATSSAQTLTINATFTGTASSGNSITLEQLIVNGE